jgi:hypothetical protein
MEKKSSVAREKGRHAEQVNSASREKSPDDGAICSCHRVKREQRVSKPSAWLGPRGNFQAVRAKTGRPGNYTDLTEQEDHSMVGSVKNTQGE